KKMHFCSRTRTPASRTSLIFVLLVFAANWQVARADRPAAQDEVTTGASSAVDLGVEQERAHHWLQAIEVYEKALKQWPENGDLKYGMRRARIHVGIERRYNDLSFENRLLRLPRYAALELFNDVLEHVHMYYVDEMGPTSFVAHGTESFYV